MRQQRWAGLGGLLALLALVTLLSTPGARGEPDDLTIGPTELGLVFVNSAEELRGDARIQRGVAAGAKMDRFPLYWDKVEPTAGQVNWSSQDAALRANEQKGLGTLAILLGTSPAYWPEGFARSVEMPPVGGGPVRALAESDAIGAGCPVQGTPPARGLYEPIFDDGSDEPAPGKDANEDNPWARFVERAVQRYRPGGSAGLHVRHWEIWNEPDLCHFWGGTPQDYARLLKVAYLVIKNEYPQATVIWGGLALYGPKYEQGSNFLTEMVAALRDDPMAAPHHGFFDAATIHQYSTVTHGYNFTRRVRSALVGTGWEDGPIWVTESGVPICDSYPGPDCPSPYRANPDAQAAYIWQNIAYTRLASNNGPIFHFQLHDDGGNECRPTPPADGFGLVTNEPGSPCVPHTAEPRLAYRAYQLAAQYLADTELLWGDIQGGTVRRVAFYHPATKERRLLVWAISGSDAVATVPATGASARRLSLDGSQATLTSLEGLYHVTVPRATNQNQPNSTSYTIGGTPYLLIERDILPPTATITELSPVSPPNFEVAWQVSDLGSGVAPTSVTLWSRAGEGPWQLWRSALPASGSDFFNGQPGVRYRFSVQATDRAGNTSNLVPLAETLVTDGSLTVHVTGQVLDVRGQPAPWALVSAGTGGNFADGSGHFDFYAPLGRWDVKVGDKVHVHGRLFLEAASLLLLLPPVSSPVVNGDFEASGGTGILGWEPGGSSPLARELLPGTRDQALRLATAFAPASGVPGTDGSAGGNSTLISQPFTVPVGAPTLSLAYKLESAETDGGNGSCGNPALLHDKFEIIVDRAGQPAHYLYCQEMGSGWRYGSFDLSAYAGQSIRLIFNVYESSPNRRTSALLDLVTVGESPTLPPPQPRGYLPIIRR